MAHLKSIIWLPILLLSQPAVGGTLELAAAGVARTSLVRHFSPVAGIRAFVEAGNTVLFGALGAELVSNVASSELALRATVRSKRRLSLGVSGGALAFYDFVGQGVGFEMVVVLAKSKMTFEAGPRRTIYTTGSTDGRSYWEATFTLGYKIY